MNLSGRDSALHTWADLRQRRELSMFSCTMLKETAWILGRRVTLSKNTAQAAGTFFATVLPEAELQGGYFNQDIEIFVVSGSIQVGDWVLKKLTTRRHSAFKAFVTSENYASSAAILPIVQQVPWLICILHLRAVRASCVLTVI